MIEALGILAGLFVLSSSKDIYQEERRARNEVEVWLVIGKEYE